MSKLEENRESAREQAIEADVYYQENCKVIPLEDVLTLINEVWNEAIKECAGCVPEEMEVTEPVANQSYSYNFYNRGHNSCREQTLQAMRQMYE